MKRLIRMFLVPCASLAVLGLSGCNQLEKLDEGESEGGSGIPPEVRAAFEGSCGKSSCHVSGGTAPTLTGGALDALVGTKYVTIGDIPSSYIAIKMLPDATLMALGLDKQRVGARMPLDLDYLNPNNQTILAWIAGAEFGGGGGTTGDTATTGDTSGGSTGDPGGDESGTPPTGDDGGTPTTGGGDDTSITSITSISGGGDDSSGGAEADGDEGCGSCRVEARPGPWALLLLLGLGAGRRRWRA